MDTSTYDLQLTTIQAHVKQTCCCYLPFIPLLFLALGSKVTSGSMNTGEFVHNRINVGMNDGKKCVNSSEIYSHIFSYQHNWRTFWRREIISM